MITRKQIELFQKRAEKDQCQFGDERLLVEICKELNIEMAEGIMEDGLINGYGVCMGRLVYMEEVDTSWLCETILGKMDINDKKNL